MCTTGAITVKNQIGQAWQALHDPKNRVVVQIAPAVRVALGEEFGLPAGAVSASLPVSHGNAGARP